MEDTALQVPPGFSPAAEMTEKWQRHLESRVRVSPWTTTRASGIGDPCERRLYYRRTEGHRERPYDPGLQAIFDLGNALEPYVVRKLEDLGYTIAQRGKDWSDPELEVTGHVDCLLARTGWPFEVPTEIKGLNDFTFEGLETIADIRDNASPWVRKYYSQLQKYLSFEKKPLGLFALLGKSSGTFRFIDCPYDEEHVKALDAKAARVRDAVRARQEPPRITSSECERCGFAHLCCPEVQFGEAPVVIENPPEDLLRALEAREEFEEAKKMYDRADKLVKGMLPEAANVVVGEYVISGKRQERGAYTVKAASFWTRKFIRKGA